MNIPLYGLLRSINHKRKAMVKERAGRILSASRRIEFVYPPTQRVCAMTFDDGPSKLPCQPPVNGDAGLTAHLLDTLKQYDAVGTFDVIGSTAENYPDTAGEVGSQYVFGHGYDHYPCFDMDSLAGAAACPELIQRMVAEGHEIANHTYRHIIYGKNRTVYRNRKPLQRLDEVVADLRRLHDLVFELTGQHIKLARPPHYIDRIPDGHTSYDAYAAMNYHYMAASFDGGGWLPTCGDYRADVDAMVAPLERALAQNPDALNGQIIFQKDGLNMSKQSPVADALPRQLALLARHGYRVVTVSQLLALSPFEDVAPDDPALPAAQALERAGYVTGYRNNRFYPDRIVTLRQLHALTGRSADDWRHLDDSPVTVDEVKARAETVWGRADGSPSSLTRRDVAVYLASQL